MDTDPELIASQLTAPGQMFEIEQIELNGATIKSWKNAPTSMAMLFQKSREYGDREFIVYQDERLTFIEHYRRVAAVANQLVTRFGIEKGDRVGIAMRNYPEWSIAFWAAASIGAVVVPLNAWWTSKELEYGLTDAGIKLLFADQPRLERVGQVESPLPLQHTVAARCEQLPQDAIAFESLLEGAAEDPSLPAVDIGPEDDATIFYTSGTTGFPKGTLGTHRNFCSVGVSMAHNNVSAMLRAGLGMEQIAAMQQVPLSALLTVPLFHVTGCHGILTAMLNMGGKLVMMHKWDPGAAIDLIERERVTMFTGVPTMAWELMHHPGVENRDLSSLLSIGYGGAPAPPELLRVLKERAPSAGVMNGWGITETSGAISANSGEEYLQHPDSVGRALEVCDVKVVDLDGKTLPVNAQGELWVRGPNVTMGYWNKPEATAEAYSDGWFHTGDVGRIDEEGLIYILDRLKDMIIRGGENVYCAEVEGVLLEHPQVQGACVFGVPHAALGEEVAAVVQVASDCQPDERELMEYAARSLAGFKVPGRIWFRHEALPTGATGKVQKKELQAVYTAVVEQEQGA